MQMSAEPSECHHLNGYLSLKSINQFSTLYSVKPYMKSSVKGKAFRFRNNCLNCLLPVFYNNHLVLKYIFDWILFFFCFAKNLFHFYFHLFFVTFIWNEMFCWNQIKNSFFYSIVSKTKLNINLRTNIHWRH